MKTRRQGDRAPVLGQGWVVDLGYEVDHDAAPLIHDMAVSAVPVDTKFDERHKATDSTRRQASQSSPRNKILPLRNGDSYE